MSLRGGRRVRGIASGDPRIVGMGDAAGVNVTPDPVTITINVDDPVVLTGGGDIVTPDPVTITLTVDDPVVIAAGPINVTPDPVNISILVDDPIVIAAGTRRGGMIPALFANP